MPNDSTTDNSKQLGNLPPDQRPAGNEQQQQGAGEPPPGLKDRDAKTSNSYGNTRESGETPKR
ncbi:hypothetical protein WG902_14790 [Ramlibacter sp. PS3R-8]|uniref:hypothetical protein n=1 Tax=Ramlibacter sp. PS3R-8 TaxID=3133437 RepID=UPI003095FABE